MQTPFLGTLELCGRLSGGKHGLFLTHETGKYKSIILIAFSIFLPIFVRNRRWVYMQRR